MNTILHLNEFKQLFKDERSFDVFCTTLAQKIAGHEDGVILACGEDVIGSLLSPVATAERVRTKIVDRLLKNPDEIAKLTQRLESEDIVD